MDMNQERKEILKFKATHARVHVFTWLMFENDVFAFTKKAAKLFYIFILKTTSKC